MIISRIRTFASIVAFVILPSIAAAQASLTGTVRDTSGAVLPGVTVGASSPALIEKLRTAVTDASGQYRIVDLRPGVYAVTFALPGFSTLRRDGIELQGQFVATIDAELDVGTLEQTVTVSGEHPVVDVQSIRRQTVVGGDVIKDLPVARTYGALLHMNPAIITGAGNNRDIQVTAGNQVFGGPGGRFNEGRLLLDGLNVGSALNGGGVSSYLIEVGNTQEVAFTTSGGLGEAEVGGPTVSIVPRTGGNVFRGVLFIANVSDWMVGHNLSRDLIERGFSRTGDVIKVWDYNLTLGGPIFVDRLWYFGGIRRQGSYRQIPNMWANKNAGDPTKWTYESDKSREAFAAGGWQTQQVRLTIQATPKNKFGIFWDEQLPCESGAVLQDVEACRASYLRERV